MAQNYKEEITAEIEEVDAVIGTNSYDELLRVIDEAYEGTKNVVMKPLSGFPESKAKRAFASGGFSEYLKIAEGCDKRCTYCIIPQLRGRYRSVPMDELLLEAASMAESGTVELNIVAQETTLYGVDIYGEKRLHILLRELCKIEGIRRIRVMYCYPEEIYDELIETIASEPRICHYLDLPIQHCNNDILKKMGRRTTKEDLLALIEKLRIKIPDIVLRTSLISGFPGETYYKHRELMDFVNTVRFDRLGVFTYSREEGTPAAAMPKQVTEKTKQKRRGEIMELQQQISNEKNQDRVGNIYEVYVEGYMPESDTYIGRTYADAPDVDGYIFFTADRTLNTGDFVNCLVTGANEYDLYGVVSS